MMDGIPGAVGFRFAVGGRRGDYLPSRRPIRGILVASGGDTFLEPLIELGKVGFFGELVHGFFDVGA
jgi:hypothetical protein